jgi:micrococcal nuclease
MKNLSTILASVSLAFNAAFGVGAFVVYEKAKEILGDPKSFVTEVVKEQLKAKAEAKVQAAIDEKKAEAKEALKSKLPYQTFLMSETKDPYVYRIKSITKVVDGDTIDANIDLGFDISLTKRIRLAGIDSPESRTTNLKEKALGLETKEWLKKTLEDAKDILIKTEKPDSTEKYGRIIGHLFINDQETSLNNQMIDEGYALEYEGGKKDMDLELLLSRRKK